MFAFFKNTYYSYASYWRKHQNGFCSSFQNANKHAWTRCFKNGIKTPSRAHADNRCFRQRGHTGPHVINEYSDAEV